MGKKKGGKSKGFVSQGAHRNVKASTLRLMKAGYNQSFDRIMNQLKALKSGKDIVVTIPNPNQDDKSRRFIRVRVSGKEYVQRMKDSGKALVQKQAD